MTSALAWLYAQHGGILHIGGATCYLCGASCTGEHSTAKCIADTFNSHHLARCPSSPSLCDACAWYLDGKAGHADFRKMSLVVARSDWRNWQRETMKQDIAQWLEHGLDDDAFLVVSLTKKKHLLLQAPMNARGSKVLAIQVEEQVAHLDLATWTTMDEAFMNLIHLGHHKGEILSGTLYAGTLRKHGRIREAMVLSQQLEPYRAGVVLELLSYTTIIDKESNERTANGPGIGAGHDSSETPQSGMEPDRPRVQEQIPHGHLEPNRNEREGMCHDDQHTAPFSQQSLWEVPGSDPRT